MFNSTGPGGTAVGANIDEAQLDIPRHEAYLQGIRNIEVRLFDIRAISDDLALTSSVFADPNIWPRLPILLADGGFEKVETYVVQPMGTQREVKFLTPVTMENIDDTVIEDGHASQDEIDALIAELYRFAENPRPVAGAPCIVQAWGRGPHKLDRAHGL